MKVKFANKVFEVLYIKEVEGLIMYAVEDEPNHIDWLVNVEVVDAEKKELKKIEQEEDAELTDFESALFSAFSDAWQEYLIGKEVDVEKWAKEHSAELLEVAREQNHVWSEEDEEMFDAIIADIKFTQKAHNHDVNQVVYEREIDWFKSLKERVQPQPKQEWKQENTGDLTDFENAMMHIGESFFGKNAGLNPNDTNTIKEQANILSGLVQSKEWSEEDEQMINDIIEAIDTQYAASDYQEMVTYLKALKERYAWKPSDEQIEAFEHFVRSMGESGYASPYDNNTKLLYSLLSDLKKLKGE